MTQDEDIGYNLLTSSKTPPSVADHVVQFAFLVCSVLIWRSSWDLWDRIFGTGVLSAVCSLLVGGFIIIICRSIRSFQSILPANEGVGWFDKTLRQIYQIFIIIVVSLLWRGCWDLADIFFPQYISYPAEPLITLVAGAVGIAVINLSWLNKFGILDQLTLEGV
mmetsp:Transcript_10129/g.13254  ORF Transcript_10129/g.13254 Transcript_10129/m.13254 type:complete len:164 (-) Transcript_10129:272-763(-)